jgi:hypothetical protein
MLPETELVVKSQRGRDWLSIAFVVIEVEDFMKIVLMSIVLIGSNMRWNWADLGG